MEFGAPGSRWCERQRKPTNQPAGPWDLLSGQLLSRFGGGHHERPGGLGVSCSSGGPGASHQAGPAGRGLVPGSMVGSPRTPGRRRGDPPSLGRGRGQVMARRRRPAVRAEPPHDPTGESVGSEGCGGVSAGGRPVPPSPAMRFREGEEWIAVGQALAWWNREPSTSRSSPPSRGRRRGPRPRRGTGAKASLSYGWTGHPRRTPKRRPGTHRRERGRAMTMMRSARSRASARSARTGRPTPTSRPSWKRPTEWIRERTGIRDDGSPDRASRRPTGRRGGRAALARRAWSRAIDC